MAIQSVVENHLWFLMSFTPFFRLPNRLVRSTWRRFLSRSFRSELKWDGNRTCVGKKMKMTFTRQGFGWRIHVCYSGLSAHPCAPCPRLFSRISGWAGQQRMEGNQQPSRRSGLQVPTSPQPCCSPEENQGRHNEFIQGWIHQANPLNLKSEVKFFGGFPFLCLPLWTVSLKTAISRHQLKCDFM